MRRTNNFDALRLAGAVAVIIGHAYHLVGRPAEVPSVAGYGVQSLGVVVFFAISGYLITASWSRSRDLFAYFTARVLRIFPALVVVIVLTVFVVGPIMSPLSFRDYLDNPRSLGYLSNIWLKPQYDLPGVLTDALYPNAVNGSLWTLPAEFFCYLVVPVLCLVPYRFRVVTLSAFLAISLYLASVAALDSPVIYATRLSDAAVMWVFFATGALIRVAVEQWRGFLRADVAVALVAVYLVVIAMAPESISWISWIALPYAVLTVGLASTPYVRSAARYGDFSYGLYLYAFPVQQIVVQQLGPMSMPLNLALVTAITAVLACVSWYAIERPSLHLKDAISRRTTSRRAPEAPAAGRRRRSRAEPVDAERQRVALTLRSGPRAGA